MKKKENGFQKAELEMILMTGDSLCGIDVIGISGEINIDDPIEMPGDEF